MRGILAQLPTENVGKGGLTDVFDAHDREFELDRVKSLATFA
jgi:hypothetical protein